MALSRETKLGGAINGNARLMGIQMIGIAAVSAWSFAVTFVIAKGFQWIPWIRLRVTEEDEDMGCDIPLCGEIAYDFTNTGIKSAV